MGRKENPQVVKNIPDACKHHKICIRVKPENIYDGDSINNVNIQVWPGIILEEVDIRIARINAPEIRTRNSEEKRRGYISKEYLASLISGKHVFVTLIGKGKYGRLVAEVETVDGKNISDIMLAKGMAKEYK